MNDVDWSGLVARADEGPKVDPLELKRRVDLVVVVEAMGVALEEQPDGKHKGLCPFHDDHTPSFDVYDTDDGAQRCGCFVCDFGPTNDVYDFLKAVRGYGFGEALREAQRYAAAGPIERRAPRQRAVRDLAGFVEAAHRSAGEDASVLRALLLDRGVTVPADWLIEQFELGVTPDGGGVVIPHRGRDGNVIAAKIRRPDPASPTGWTDALSVSGSQLKEMYAVWRDMRHAQVVLVEGETDTWSTSYLLRDSEVDVLGLPSGAAARPRREWIDYLGDREATFLFDADDAGRVALRNWAAALGVARVAQLEEGLDATSASPHRVALALAHPLALGLAATPGLVEAPFGGWIRANDQQQTMISDFTLRVVRTIALDDGGYVFEVKLVRGDETRAPIERLSSSDLETDVRLRHWANQRGHVFYGSSRDSQEILRMLLIDSVYAARVRGTATAGLAPDRSGFVFPDPTGPIGTRSWAYVPPVANIRLDEQLDLAPASWDPQVPLTLIRLHEPDVVTPIVGWVAASPLRSLIRSFPVLAVVGAAGNGKSTLMREILRTFGFGIEATLTSTTPHAIASFAAATNGAPVWVDEYRVGARPDTRLAFEQVLRDAWDASSSWKGGLGEQRQALTELPSSAPIAVTGEDAFSETSHLERMVMVNLPREGRSRSALETLRALRRRGFGRAYLEWLIETYRAGLLPAPPEVSDRKQQARAVAAWGYGLLDAFTREVVGIELPVAYDASLIERAHGEQDANPVIDEALRVCEGRFGRAGPVVWREGEELCVRVHDLVKECRELAIPLPGGARAVRNELGDRYVVAEDRNTWGTFLRLRGR